MPHILTILFTFPSEDSARHFVVRVAHTEDVACLRDGTNVHVVAASALLERLTSYAVNCGGDLVCD